MGVLENCVREDLNEHAERRMAVLHPLKVVITNYPEGQVEELEVANHPQKPEMGTRHLPFSGEVYIDKNDFMEIPPNNKFKRLIAGGEVRLRNAYVIKCEEVIKDAHGEVIELHCSYDADTLGKNPEGRKVKGVIHWVSVAHALPAEVRLYDRLFSHPTPDAVRDGSDYKDHINPESLLTLTQAMLEPSLARAQPGQTVQFEREGYFCADEVHTADGKAVFNRTVTLRDTWAKIAGK
jgi:glutaminyl-tRNA synthetase